MSKDDTTIYGQVGREVLNAIINKINNEYIGPRTARSVHMDVGADCHAIIVSDSWRFRYSGFCIAVKECLKHCTAGSPKGIVDGFNWKDRLDEEVVITFRPKGGHWDEQQTVKTTVAHFRCIYELLMKRDDKRILKTYGDKVFNEVKGHAANMFVIAQRSMITKNITDLNEEIKAINQQISNEREAAYREVRERFAKKLDEMTESVTKKIKELEAQLHGLA